MSFAAEGPMAIPLWINGRALLTVTDSFFDVTDPVSGTVVRRTPLAGTPEVAEAVTAAQTALGSWLALPVEERQACLSALAKALDQYTGHFAKLVRQETGCDEAFAQSEVSSSVSALSAGESAAQTGIVAVIADASRNLSAVVEAIAPLLRGGAAVIVKPSPKAPGAAFALAELSGRVGFPAGIFNLVHGDTQAINAICAEAKIAAVLVRGEAKFVEQVQQLAEKKARTLMA